MNKKTKIVATLGPASSSIDMIRKLAIAGVDVFRLNFSHGSAENHKNNASAIRTVEYELEKNIAIMMDLQGPKIRIGVFEDGCVTLKQGSKFILDLEKDYGNVSRVSLPHPELFNALKDGTELLLDDGKIKLIVTENNGRFIETEVIEGGVLSNKKGVNIPNIILPINVLTNVDKKNIEFINDISADIVAVSFVQSADDVIYARNFIDKDVLILAKIEKPSAVQNIDDILKVSDAVMVARGDLGVELPFESIPSIQKHIVNRAKFFNRPVIVATQMLESMINCHIPTRAEVSDVACAVAEGADAVMLSAESASGHYPEEAVKTMAKIIRNTENSDLCFCNEKFEFGSNMARAVLEIEKDPKIKAIVAFTESGRCARNIANVRPKNKIIAMTPNQTTARKLALIKGVEPLIVDEIFSFSQMAQLANKNLIANGLQSGDKIIILAGVPYRNAGQTNLLYVHKIETNS